MKAIVGANVGALVKSRDRDFDAACKRLGMKETQLKRVISGKHAVTMRTIQRIADGYEVEPYQLLVPDLDPANPQILRTLGAIEDKLHQCVDNRNKFVP